MNESTFRQILDTTKLEILDAVMRVDYRVERLDATLDARIDARIDAKVTPTLTQHGQALQELARDLRDVRTTLGEHTAILGEHSASLGGISIVLGRVERRQGDDTGTLIDHERRISALERRP